MFDNIVGNNEIKRTLEMSVNLGKISHSYLFVGMSGIGKKLIAKEFAKSILCIKSKLYCGSCKSCMEFDTKNHPDFSEIEPEGKSVKIEQIRELQKKVAEKPIISSRKVYIINEADTMTQEAQNCLLKTLEEPPEFVTIILITSNENSLLTTIKSRCTIMHFSKIANAEINNYLKKQYNLQVSENIINMADGSISKALEIKDKEKIYSNIENIIKNLEKCDIIQILKQAEFIYKSKDEIFEILEYMNFLLLENSKKDCKYANCINIVEETKRRIKSNSNYNMCIDYMLFSIWREVNEKYSWSKI